MLNKVIENLKNIENQTSQKLVDIFTNKQEVVNESFYSSTIFGSQENYTKNEGFLNGQIIGPFQKKMVETPLVFIRAKQQPVFCSGLNQGIDFGFTMVDYRTSKPLVVVTVTYGNSEFKYESIMFDTETSTYTQSETATKTCTDINELISFVLENTEKDINKWINK